MEKLKKIPYHSVYNITFNCNKFTSSIFDTKIKAKLANKNDTADLKKDRF